MPEVRAEDMREPIPIQTEPLISAIPTDDEELLELKENLRVWAARVCSPNLGMSKWTMC